MFGARSAIIALGALLGLGAPAACRSSAEPVAADDTLFVHTMGELRRIKADPALDSAARDSAREATLRTHGVSAEELEEMARELARDPKRALDDWREIERISAQNPAIRQRDSADSGVQR